MTTASEASLRYVYAVCRPFDGLLPEGAHGITGEPPRLVRHDGLAAVVDAVPAEEFDEGPCANCWATWTGWPRSPAPTRP